MKKIVYLSVLVFSLSCEKKINEKPFIEPEKKELQFDNKAAIALKWSDLTIQVLKDSPNNSPTYASRALGYIGLTMYESIVNGSIVYQSIAKDLNGLGALPKNDENITLDWEVALSSGQSQIIKLMYPHAPEYIVQKIDSLHLSIIMEKANLGLTDSILVPSVLYGKTIAFHIYEWSKTDKGHEGYKITFDKEYPYPRAYNSWSPPRFGQSIELAPMHPYWGENRTFIPANMNMTVPEIIPFSRDTSSAYFKEMKLVYDKNISLTTSEKETALWWGDDPGSSASPPGHSYYLTSQLIRSRQSGLFEATSAFAKVGMSVADSFINCWKCKYLYHSERPRNYIVRNIDSRFIQFWPEPPFPAYSSGHSTQAASAAIAMISVFGDDNAITDAFHTGRPMDTERNVAFKTRFFDSVWQTAEECGWSRILGGIHMPQDNDTGLEEGKVIGENVVSLPWIYE